MRRSLSLALDPVRTHVNQLRPIILRWRFVLQSPDNMANRIIGFGAGQRTLYAEPGLFLGNTTNNLTWLITRVEYWPNLCFRCLEKLYWIWAKSGELKILYLTNRTLSLLFLLFSNVLSAFFVIPPDHTWCFNILVHWSSQLAISDTKIVLCIINMKLNRPPSISIRLTFKAYDAVFHLFVRI